MAQDDAPAPPDESDEAGVRRYIAQNSGLADG